MEGRSEIDRIELHLAKGVIFNGRSRYLDEAYDGEQAFEKL